MATRDRRALREAEALDAYLTLLRAAGSVALRVQRHLVRHDLTASQFGALEALHRLGPLCQRDIARRLVQTGGNVTMVVRGLERRGLIERRRDPANRRFVTVQLSARGKRLIAALLPRHARAVAAEMRALGHPRLKVLGRLCKKLER
ncbi:MAG TPA: MarR family transcriptional regulator [Planctomycetota bacterium]|jgi:MarR family 2-MHQ and catechol resistance regulon transcriptional repressor